MQVLFLVLFIGLGLTVYSFLPQQQLTHSSKDTSGLSLFSLVLNTVCATEQFLVGLIYINLPHGADFFIENPKSWGDWLNFCQLATVWVLFVLQLGMCLWYPSPGLSRGRKIYAATLYGIFLAISLAPGALLIVLLHQDPDVDFTHAIFSGCHLLYVNPAVPWLSMGAFLSQVITLLRSGPQHRSGISVRGLDYPLPWPLIYAWFLWVGWPAVDSLIFAVGQGLLFLLAARRRAVVGTLEATTGETEPLLTSR
ncbi:hypothetical protein ASPACDRAFT_1879454 [Aspergillus aculeatus ATCC 16872]|uniref:EXPERA domain-containing protein n=1 Tax=Aspergillus aculeatus (strain ATCC 16872 / CBS 172.66 / WB 5094) TaxID=690307 RepID=A0A1L9X0I3_ASPA1|nr:uncharacterized protein ASPACDRAFT_1879454 [Aspergillus aculeatus ATCC 16872]OJK01961.1 hypothetical protein ASPACDRAFT_1879454 [Aspergillus aculeatus ATCC 16872]